MEDLEVTDGRVFLRDDPEKGLPLSRIVTGYVYDGGNAIGGPIIGRGRYIARYLSGGTEIITMARDGKLHPGALIDLKRIPETLGVTQKGKEFRYGSSVPLSTVADEPERSRFPLLARAASSYPTVHFYRRSTLPRRCRRRSGRTDGGRGTPGSTIPW